MHGGALSSGAPKGERNGAFNSGAFTAEMIEVRREIARVNRAWRKWQKSVSSGPGT